MAGSGGGAANGDGGNYYDGGYYCADTDDVDVNERASNDDGGVNNSIDRLYENNNIGKI